MYYTTQGGEVVHATAADKTHLGSECSTVYGTRVPTIEAGYIGTNPLYS
eukprot:g17281.t1